MKHLIYCTFSFLLFCSCSSKIDVSSPDIDLAKIYISEFKLSKIQTDQVDVRSIITPKMLESPGNPVLYVEKASGLNGTLALYPGANLEETWYTADGATISLFNGEIIAKQGMGNDIINTNIPRLNTYSERLQDPYQKSISLLTSENKIQVIELVCTMSREIENTDIEIFRIKHNVSKYIEKCRNNEYNIENEFWQNFEGTTLKSIQWHNESDEYILIMRLR